MNAPIKGKAGAYPGRGALGASAPRVTKGAQKEEKGKEREKRGKDRKKINQHEE